MKNKMSKTNEQKLIDIIFQVAQISSLHWNSDNYYGDHQEKHMEWVAQQLKGRGFETKPIGMSWGVLINAN